MVDKMFLMSEDFLKQFGSLARVVKRAEPFSRSIFSECACEFRRELFSFYQMFPQRLLFALFVFRTRIEFLHGISSTFVIFNNRVINGLLNVFVIISQIVDNVKSRKRVF